jgi:hypothetical protein
MTGGRIIKSTTRHAVMLLARLSPHPDGKAHPAIATGLAILDATDAN